MPQSIIPIAYHLTIEPDLDRFDFNGRVTLSAQTHGTVDALVLDCAELAIWNCQLAVKGQEEKNISCPFTVNPEKENLTVHFPKPVTGEFDLTITYSGKINDRMAGFYRSRIDVGAGPSHIAITQFQESDARRAFPCLDHPAQKSIFSVCLVIEKALTAISNTDVQTIETLENKKQRVAFYPTPKMSTYLLFFGVGPFEIHEDPVDPRVRAVCLPGMGDQTEFGREFGRKALNFGETYYGIDYPLTKMDLIAVPDFAFGAMENWGAITFRENLLLNVPGVTSREAQSRICEVIAHEIVHQWFGNLVTPERWKYLWLNESFATYFGYGMVNHYHREWEVWHQFVKGQTETAMTRDAFIETFAIEMPGEAEVAITTSTAPIIYSKGGSILRQLEAWIGPDHFRNGLRRYLTDFAYDCAASHHLWESFATASGLPVDKLMQNWVTQPGFPMIVADRQGDTVSLSQRRFSFSSTDETQRWMIPISLTAYQSDGAAKQTTLLMETENTELSLSPETVTYKINTDQTGFYHVCYQDTENLARLGNMVKDGTLSPLDRWGLQNDLFALAKAGHATMTDFLNFSNNFSNDFDYLSISSLVGHLYETALLLQGDIQSRSRQTAETVAISVLGTIGWEPKAGESQTTAMLRDQLFIQGAMMGNRKILDALVDPFEAWSKGTAIPPDSVRGVITAGAVSNGQAALDLLIRRFEESRIEHERMTIAVVLGSFSQWPVLEKALAYALEEIPDRIRFMPLVSAASNQAGVDRLWCWFEENTSAMHHMHPLLFERVVAAMVPVPGLTDPVRTRSFCHELMEKQHRLKDVIALSLERLRVNMDWRERNER